MIYRFLLVFAFVLGGVPAFAAPPKSPAIALSFDKLPLLDFLNVVYGDILKQNFSVHPDLLGTEKLVTVHFSDVDKGNVQSFVSSLLAGLSIDVEKHSGYVFVRPAAVLPKKEEELEVFFYRPKFRAVSELVDLTSALFKVGAFTGQRSVRSPSASSPSASSSSPLFPPPRDTGTSAYSLTDKSDRDSFVFQGTKKEIAMLEKLLEQLDTPVGELLVKGVVYEVAIGARETNAIRLFADVVGNSIGVAFGVVSGNSLTVRTGNLDTVLSALSTDSRFKTITTPSLRVKSGGDARFSVGSDVPVLGSVQLDKNGNPVQSVEYKPSGTIFAVKPTVHANTIDLHVFQQLSTFVQTTTGVNNSPTLNKREITTQITAKDGDLIVLGGLDEDKSGNDSSGISFLPDWMRSKGSETTKTQILLILQVQRL